MKFSRTAAIFLAILITILSFTSCQSAPPDLATVKSELVTLVEASYEINEIFFGNGLPTHARGGAYDTEYRLYEGTGFEYDYYEYVTQESPYHFVDQIKAAAEQVYTAEYLKGIYTMAFDGYADENTGNVTTARYLETNGWLMKYAFGESDPFNILPGKRVYDFDTMEIVKPSTAKYLNVEVDSHVEGAENGEVMHLTLRFKLTEDGWRLDAPTY
jgi:hypothetical protein